MGRSVEVPSNAAVTFFYFDENAPIDSYYNDDFEFASEDFVHDLLAEFPSLSGFVGRSNQFEHGRETVIMAYNWLADITVSRYGSLVAVSMVPSLEYRGLALNWISQVEDKVREFGAVFGTEVRRRGTLQTVKESTRELHEALDRHDGCSYIEYRLNEHKANGTH